LTCNVIEGAVAKSNMTKTPVAPKISDYKKVFRGQSLLRRKQIQYALKNLGFYSSGIDGLWGQGTSSAIANYTESNGVVSNSPSNVFRSILSKVDVPSSFAVPKRLINKTKLYTEYVCTTNKVYVKTPEFEISTNKGMTAATMVSPDGQLKCNAKETKELIGVFQLDQSTFLRFFKDNKVAFHDQQMTEQKISEILRSESPENRLKLKKMFKKLIAPKTYKITNNVASWSQKFPKELGLGAGTLDHSFNLTTNQYLGRSKVKIPSVGKSNIKTWATCNLH